MNVCFPVEKNLGLESPVFNHFGSAPLFLLVNTDTGTVTEEVNRDLGHEHGKCSPIAALGGKQVDAVVVGGIGGGAINGLTRAGIKVFKAHGGSIAANMEKFVKGSLDPFNPGMVCGGHSHGGGCAHG